LDVGRLRHLLLLGAWPLAGALTQPEPVLSYDPSIFDVTAPHPAPAPPPPEPRDAAAPGKAQYRLTIDFAAIADSNATNGTRLREVPVLVEGERVPVPLDPRLRRKSGLGRSAALSASATVPIARVASVIASADAYYVDYAGSLSDDASVTFATGLELGPQAHRTTLEAMLFDRWYAHESAMAGWGLRLSHRSAIAPGQTLRAVGEARVYRSGYGRAFDGRQASAWVSYDAVLDPSLTASASVYVRRDALRDRAYASTEVGGAASLAYYLGPDFSGALTLGVGRAWFDAPIPYLATFAREDWRPSAAVSVTTRHPVLWGFYPSLAYSYGRTASSLPFYASDRHRLRLGVARTFQ
jgi:hypothetical protein